MQARKTGSSSPLYADTSKQLTYNKCLTRSKQTICNSQLTCNKHQICTLYPKTGQYQHFSHTHGVRWQVPAACAMYRLQSLKQPRRWPQYSGTLGQEGWLVKKTQTSCQLGRSTTPLLTQAKQRTAKMSQQTTCMSDGLKVQTQPVMPKYCDNGKLPDLGLNASKNIVSRNHVHKPDLTGYTKHTQCNAGSDLCQACIPPPVAQWRLDTSVHALHTRSAVPQTQIDMNLQHNAAITVIGVTHAHIGGTGADCQMTPVTSMFASLHDTTWIDGGIIYVVHNGAYPSLEHKDPGTAEYAKHIGHLHPNLLPTSRADIMPMQCLMSQSERAQE